MWKFSKHIIERIEERKITKEMVLSVVNREVDILIYPSPKDETIDLYFGKVNNVYFLVVANRETKNLVTVRNMRTNEKKVYREEFENGN